jgi:predicted NBD/HSP70 family sugar kinase
MTGSIRITEKSTPAVLRERNTQLVLQSVLSGGGAVSRADIARSSGLARAVVSEIVENLLARHLVVEDAAEPRGRGKPAKPLRVDDERHCLLAVAIKPGAAQVGVVGLDGMIRATTQAPLPEQPDVSDVVAALAPRLREVADRDGRDVLGLGVAVPGIVSKDQRVMQALQLSWRDVDLAEPLATAQGHDVIVVNDATAVAMSELSYQEQAGASVIVLHIDAGIGSAVLLEGRVHLGERQRAGEVGHIDVGVSDLACSCGRRGCLETVASLPAVLGGLPEEALDDVSTSAVPAGTADLEALAARVDRAGRSLAALICAQAAVLDISEVVIDGPIRRAGPRLLDAIERELAVRRPPADVRRPRFSIMGARSILHGAAASAMHHRLGAMWHLQDRDPVSGADEPGRT